MIEYNYVEHESPVFPATDFPESGPLVPHTRTNMKIYTHVICIYIYIRRIIDPYIWSIFDHARKTTLSCVLNRSAPFT